MPFRIRVSMSAMGSLMFILCSFLPTGLDHARQLAARGALAEADAAHAELPHERSRAAAQETPAVLLHLELRGPGGLGDHRFLGHEVSLSRSERHAQELEQPAAFFVSAS